MKKYKYYVLMRSLPPMGGDIAGSEWELQKLTDGGWRPVRETPMGGGPVIGRDTTSGVGYVFASLILLEKDDEA